MDIITDLNQLQASASKVNRVIRVVELPSDQRLWIVTELVAKSLYGEIPIREERLFSSADDVERYLGSL